MHSHAGIRALQDYLKKLGPARLHLNLPITSPEHENDDPSVQESAALKIQAAWRRYKFQESLIENSYTSVLQMQDDTQDRSLSQAMFGMTVAAHVKHGPKFVPRNPKAHSGSIYYRTDAVAGLQSDLKNIIKKYDSRSDQARYNYIPVTLSEMISIKDLIKEYMPAYEASIEVLNLPGQSLAFIKVEKSDERFFVINKILSSLGLIPPNFTMRVAGLGIKASPWQLATSQVDNMIAHEQKHSTRFEAMKSHLPGNLHDLKNSEVMEKLGAIARSPESPTGHLASCLFKLIQGLPDNATISEKMIKVIGAHLDLAATLNSNDYDRFSFSVYCVIHQLSLILAKKGFQVSFERFKKDAIENGISAFGLPPTHPPTHPASSYRYIALPANSGTNAMTLALHLAQMAYKDQKVSIRSEGNIYFEFETLGLTKESKTDDTRKIYLITAGPTTWEGIYPGADVNKIIREIISKHSLPCTIIIDATSGLYESLKIDDDLKPLIASGRISLLVHESHQKFGLLHSDQAQYGRVFGVLAAADYSEAICSQFEEKAAQDLSNNIDMQIGAYVSVQGGKAHEEIKKRHFMNGSELRGLFESLNLQKTKIIRDEHSLPADRSLFVYGGLASVLGGVVRRQLEFRSSFGHFNTTWSPVGVYYRISPSASDKTDILIEGTELYLASKFSKAKLAWHLRKMMENQVKSGRQFASLGNQILLAGLLQALRKLNYVPKNQEDSFILSYSTNFMRYKCGYLKGRKVYHEILEGQPERKKNPQGCNYLASALIDNNNEIRLRLFALSLEPELRQKFLTAALAYSIHKGVHAIRYLSWYIKNGANVLPAIQQIHKTTRIKEAELLISHLDKFEIKPNQIPVSQARGEVSLLLRQARAIARLKQECKAYLHYLKASRKTDPQTKERLEFVDSLNKTLSFANLNETMASINEKFTPREKIRKLFGNDPQGIKLVRIAFGVMSLGLFAVYRGLKIGSMRFWKSRHELYLTQAKQNIQLKRSFK